MVWADSRSRLTAASTAVDHNSASQATTVTGGAPAALVPPQASVLRTQAQISLPAAIATGMMERREQAGTTLAVYFDKVCGHKGYSYDAVQSLDRRGKKDLFSTKYPGFSRRRVPLKVMAEIGYENCDWISQETG